MPLQDWSESILRLDDARARLKALNSNTAKAGYGHACIEKVVEALRQHNHQAEVYVAELVSELEKEPKQVRVDPIVRTAKLAIGAHIDTHRELTSNAIRAEIPPPKPLDDDLFGCQVQLATLRPHAANKLWKSLHDVKVRGKGFESCAEMPGICDPRLSSTTSPSSVPSILEAQLKQSEDGRAATSQAVPLPATEDEATREGSIFENLHASVGSDQPTASAHSIDSEDSTEKVLLCMRWQFGTSLKERSQQGSGIRTTLNGFGTTAVQYWEEDDRAALAAIMPSHLRAARAATSLARASHLSVRTIVLAHCGVNIRQSYIDQTFRLSGEGFYDAISALQIAFKLGHTTDSTSIFCTRSFLATLPKDLHEQFKSKEVPSNGASVSLFLLELQQEQAAELVDSWHKVRSWLKLNVDRFVAGAVSAGAAMLIPWIISQFKTPPESFAKVIARLANEPSGKTPCGAFGQVLDVKFEGQEAAMPVVLDAHCNAVISLPVSKHGRPPPPLRASIVIPDQSKTQFAIDQQGSGPVHVELVPGKTLYINLVPIDFPPPRNTIILNASIAGENLDGKSQCGARGQVLEISFNKSSTPVLAALDNHCKASVLLPTQQEDKPLEAVIGSIAMSEHSEPRFVVAGTSFAKPFHVDITLKPVQVLQLERNQCGTGGKEATVTLDDQITLKGTVNGSCRALLPYAAAHNGKQVRDVVLSTGKHFCSPKATPLRVGEAWPQLVPCVTCPVQLANNSNTVVFMRIPCLLAGGTSQPSIAKGETQSFYLNPPGCRYACWSESGATRLNCEMEPNLRCNGTYEIK